MAAKKIKGLIDSIQVKVHGIDGQTGDIPDDINPRVLILRHQQIYEPQRFAPKSAEHIYEENQTAVDASAQQLMSQLNRLQQDRRFVTDSQPPEAQTPINDTQNSSY